uniref:MPN domain-containing protein n=1 Tax=Pseudictyota dubia TaxID=2749911 RepID=A0A7R9W1G9_9STRA
MTEPQQKVSTSQLALVKMFLHASHNSTSQVHGILVGRFSVGPKLTIEDAVPLFHSAPTKPILDSALRIIESHLCGSGDELCVVGWYTANERLGDDERPGQAALRIIGGIASRLECSEKALPAHSEPVLALVRNSGLAELLCVESCDAQRAIGFFQRDNRKHWIDPVSEVFTSVAEEGSKDGSWKNAGEMAAVACKSDSKAVSIVDFEDHLDGSLDTIRSTDWLMNQKVVDFVSKNG